METLGIIFLVLLLLSVWLGILAVVVVGYILGSKSLYTIAARRGIKNPWMAWIPVASNWILGCVSDQYAQRKYGCDPNLRKKLLIFTIITQSGMSVFPTMGGVTVNFNFDLGGELPEAARIVMLVLLMIMLVWAMAMLVLSVIQTVYQCKACYNLYASCKPQLAVVYLVLCIATPAGPFLTYACRNSDAGMPAQPESET